MTSLALSRDQGPIGVSAVADRLQGAKRVLRSVGTSPVAKTGTALDALPASAFRQVIKRWSVPCDAAFEWLAHHQPQALLDLIESQQLQTADLTFAAEIAGTIDDAASVRRTLLPLLDLRYDSVVREGALYGLANSLDQAARNRIAQVAAGDPSEAVREAAHDTLARV
jgi:hypothetical protein